MMPFPPLSVPRWLSQPLRRSDAGVQTTLVAILFPGLLLLVFLTVQAGIYYHTRQWAATASDRAVAQAAEIGADDGQVESQIAGFLPGHFCADGWAVSVNRSAAEGTVTASVSCAAPGPLAPWPVNSSSTAPLERFIPETDRE